MPEPEHRLQVLIANEQHDRLERIKALVEALGHEIVGSAVDIGEVGALSRSTDAEVALVGLGLDGEHALEEISQIVHEAACPVIALIDAEDPSYVQQAAQRGVFAYVVLDGEEAAELQGALDITLRRFAESRTCKVRSVDERSSSKPRASSWSETASTPKRRSLC